jgi:hypothetical protein
LFYILRLDDHDEEDDKTEGGVIDDLKEYGTIVGSIMGSVLFGLILGIVVKAYNRKRMLYDLSETLMALRNAPSPPMGGLLSTRYDSGGAGGGVVATGSHVGDSVQTFRMEVEEPGNENCCEAEPPIPPYPISSTPKHSWFRKWGRGNNKFPPPPSPIVGRHYQGGLEPIEEIEMEQLDGISPDDNHQLPSARPNGPPPPRPSRPPVVAPKPVIEHGGDGRLNKTHFI